MAIRIPEEILPTTHVQAEAAFAEAFARLLEELDR